MTDDEQWRYGLAIGALRYIRDQTSPRRLYPIHARVWAKANATLGNTNPITFGLKCVLKNVGT